MRGLVRSNHLLGIACAKVWSLPVLVPRPSVATRMASDSRPGVPFSARHTVLRLGVLSSFLGQDHPCPLACMARHLRVALVGPDVVIRHCLRPLAPTCLSPRAYACHNTRHHPD